MGVEKKFNLKRKINVKREGKNRKGKHGGGGRQEQIGTAVRGPMR